ncbi:hypothetical protein [Flavihumibacter petaseus]|uniref:Uncharacterized protein n=1 Tax=Flavihumibacter petaseus NBRC 106054 TaxID=1220578 RepID=A0A0E9N2J1_9BACT|nr:hypothetical protein [Flavihumibacter petaseus]GAO44013.1 hypothetical protein FPE01S_03_00520 [Flavihumibacter petaseus NBRC 106054]
MNSTKKVYFLVIAFIAVIVLLWYSRSGKILTITGFGNQGDSVIISQVDWRESRLGFECDRGVMGGCFLQGETDLLPWPAEPRIRLRLINGSNILLDTSLEIPARNQLPVISFDGPLQPGMERSFFLGDGRD